jgi:hypothetical protein
MIASRERNGHTPSAFAPDTRNVDGRDDDGETISSSVFDPKKVEEVVTTFVRDHAGASLLIALAIGGIAGWFLKRKM